MAFKRFYRTVRRPVRTRPVEDGASELTEEIARSFGVGGDTKEKAVRFFLSAATFAGIEVSPLLAKVRGPGMNAEIRRNLSRKRISARRRALVAQQYAQNGVDDRQPIGVNPAWLASWSAVVGITESPTRGRSMVKMQPWSARVRA